MITIDQLLESVDLDFEPRWVTKDKDGDVWIWNIRPDKNANWCLKKGTSKPFRGRFISECLKLAEFENKDWTECIYEVPRKADEFEQNLEKLRPADSDLVYRVKLPRKTTRKIEKLKEVSIIRDGDFPSIESTVKVLNRIINRLNDLVDAVNELKERTEPTTLNPDLTDEDLRKMMRDPKYWRDKDASIIQKVQDGFNKLYGDKN